VLSSKVGSCDSASASAERDSAVEAAAFGAARAGLAAFAGTAMGGAVCANAGAPAISVATAAITDLFIRSYLRKRLMAPDGRD
jgi:hypothetical protein